MRIQRSDIEQHNHQHLEGHRKKLAFIADQVADTEKIINQIAAMQIAIPSWALGTGGTRFGRFAGGGEPGTLEQKIEDIGLLHALTGSSGAISLHIPWDIPKDATAVAALASSFGIRFDAVNSNTFQDQKDQKLSYKFGSMQHVDRHVRKQAIDHNLQVIEYGKALGSKAITVWLSDGSSFPGQLDFRKAFENTLESLQSVYSGLPSNWKMFVEYKAFEPNFYSMTVGDWGQSLLYAQKLGNQAYALVDLGHHLPNANIEQIVSLLLMEGKLGGFHFNDSKYGDDDLTVGSINPYQLFLIFNELVAGMDRTGQDLAWMIDASHNIKDPLEDLLQSVEAILVAYAQSLILDSRGLEQARNENDVVRCQELLQQAFRTDVRPLIAEARLKNGAAIHPITAFRTLECRKNLIRERGTETKATGL